MTNEEIVLDRLNNPFLGKLPICYKASESYTPYYIDISPKNYQIKLNDEIKDLKSKISIKDRVDKILGIRNYPTYSIKNRFQCKPGARRSAVDIWRIYKNYFGEIDIFPIMRALWELVYGDRVLNTIKCSTVRKQVFWPSETRRNVFVNSNYNSELGISLRNWKNIGLKEGDDEWKD